VADRLHVGTSTVNGAVDRKAGSVDDSAAGLASCEARGRQKSANGERGERTHEKKKPTSDDFALGRDQDQVADGHHLREEGSAPSFNIICSQMTCRECEAEGVAPEVVRVSGVSYSQMARL
jgi:hypothetical protein